MDIAGCDTYHGWGRKRSGLRAIQHARKTDQGYLLKEDGFLRSVERDGVALSIVQDDTGIYYDATAPSRLEKLIARPLGPAAEQRAEVLIEHWRAGRLSKYNGARDYAGVLPKHYVLVVDQTAGDLSIQFGQADAAAFDRMLASALSENPDATVVLKVHPDIYTRKKRGHFHLQDLEKNDRILLIAEYCHPVRLIEQADAVYCVTSQMGFEALIWDKKVRCFGMPFYAGWGLTEDELPGPERRRCASRAQLVHAALVDYPEYTDPETGMHCEPEYIMSYVVLQRKMRSRFPEKLYALGFSLRKRKLISLFFQGSDVIFAGSEKQVPDGETVLLWGSADGGQLDGRCKILRIEDGFLRSAGLGADLVRPLSWVVDDLGIYYDAARESRLESILNTSEFDDTLLRRARQLRGKIVSKGIGKYNLGGFCWERPSGAGHVVLVPGQVENDASVRFGAPEGASNLGLLKAVRTMHPEAYIVYKPHPDVVAGLRKKGTGEMEAEHWCDEIVETGDMCRLIEEVDEIHTLTSLAGFEALLRNKPVTCHGMPFYAGWGLTTDLHLSERRTRKLHLDELVAGALILYPTYTSRITDAFTTPERAVEELIEWRDCAGKPSFSRWVLRTGLKIWAVSGWRKNA